MEANLTRNQDVCVRVCRCVHVYVRCSSPSVSCFILRAECKNHKALNVPGHIKALTDPGLRSVLSRISCENSQECQVNSLDGFINASKCHVNALRSRPDLERRAREHECVWCASDSAPVNLQTTLWGWTTRKRIPESFKRITLPFLLLLRWKLRHAIEILGR